MFDFFRLVQEKVKLNLKAEASQSYLSYFWWILEPILFVTVFYVVFGIFLNRGTEDFVVFLVCGKIPFLWFSRTVSNSAMSIVQGKGLMNQVPINKLFFPIVVIMQDFYKSTIVILLMCLFALLNGFPITYLWLFLPLIVFVQLLFNSAIAILTSMMIPFLPDLRFIVNTILMLLMFASGIFYSFESVLLPEHRSLFLLNPIASLIQSYRDILMFYKVPDLLRLFSITLFSIMLLLLLIMLMKRLSHHYPKLVQQ